MAFGKNKNDETTASEAEAKKYKKVSRRLGGYSTAMMVIVVVAAVVINLIVAAIPTKYTNISTSTTDYYSISDTTLDILDELDMDVTIYYVSTLVNRDTILYNFVTQYADLSSHITVEMLDPEANPTFVEDNEIERENSIVVVSELRSEMVSYIDFYYSEDEQENFENYYYSYYTYYGYTDITDMPYSAFYGDSMLTSAINYVTSEIIPSVYVLTGHGEDDVPSMFSTSIESLMSIEWGEISSIADSGIPEDAAMIIINDPETDIAAGELELLEAYIDGGGKILLVTGLSHYSSEDLPNFLALAEYCGLSAVDGMVLDSDSNYYSGTKDILVPDIEGYGLLEYLEGYSPRMSSSHAIIEYEDYEGDMVVSPLLTTSSSSYVVAKGDGVRSQEDDDESGPFYLGAISEDSDTGAAFIWFSSTDICDEYIYYYYNSIDAYVFLYTMVQVCDVTESVSIDGITVASTDYLSISTTTEQIALTVLFIAIIPLAALIPGIVIYVRRRRR
ncbi:MAG: GldG family protein [Firmicutes bacterium]|nr:GldG family protein [Bacillota bacterium]MCD8314189.1 GldG family protein [Bacillota bacterium]